MLNRRLLLQGLGSAALASPAVAPSLSTAGQRPRKVIVGTMMQSFWGEHPGLDRRLDQFASAIGEMAAESRTKYGRGIDLAILPETSISGEAYGDAVGRSFPYEGPVAVMFQKLAREHRCYIVVSTYLREANDPKRCSNASILIARNGSVAGIYRKVHLDRKGHRFYRSAGAQSVGS